MPVSPNLMAVLGAGVFGVVCAATLFVVEQLRHERRRHGMARDLQRLNMEMEIVRHELNSLMSTINTQTVQAKKTKRARTKSAVSSAASEDYVSALDSSDLEFYDVSDDDEDTTITETYPISSGLEEVLLKIDAVIESGHTFQDFEQVLRKLEELGMEHPENPHLLWRIGRVHYKLHEKTDDVKAKQENLSKGLNACNAALHLEPELPQVHKWIAILIGSRTKYQPMKEKIMDGYLLKHHVDEAIKLSPDDPILYHMLGRFCHDVADLTWYERKIASALFATPPSSTFDEALQHFVTAQRLADYEWKENKLYVAKCKLKLGDYEEAIKCLEEAKGIESDENGEVEKEIADLLKKYKR